MPGLDRYPSMTGWNVVVTPVIKLYDRCQWWQCLKLWWQCLKLCMNACLDSDDLIDLRELLKIVARSDVLVLLQTTNVLTRPCEYNDAHCGTGRQASCSLAAGCAAAGCRARAPRRTSSRRSSSSAIQ